MEANALVECVREFMVSKVGAPDPQHLPIREAHGINEAGELLISESKRLLQTYDKNHDQRFLRTSLMLEELGESLQGMSVCDEVAVLDGLADLLYGLIGTAIQFDLPIIEAFLEVHRSNMTKRDYAGDCRIRDKGPDYVPPDLGRVLREYRASQVS